MNFLNGTIENDGDKLVAIFNGNKIEIPAEKAKVLKAAGYVGKEVVFGIRPEHISDKEELIEANPNSVIKGNVEVIELMGAESYIYTKCGNSNMNVRVEGTTALKIGQEAKLFLDTTKLHVFNKDTENKIV